MLSWSLTYHQMQKNERKRKLVDSIRQFYTNRTEDTVIIVSFQWLIISSLIAFIHTFIRFMHFAVHFNSQRAKTSRDAVFGLFGQSSRRLSNRVIYLFEAIIFDDYLLTTASMFALKGSHHYIRCSTAKALNKLFSNFSGDINRIYVRFDDHFWIVGNPTLIATDVTRLSTIDPQLTALWAHSWLTCQSLSSNSVDITKQT